MLPELLPLQLTCQLLVGNLLLLRSREVGRKRLQRVTAARACRATPSSTARAPALATRALAPAA